MEKRRPRKKRSGCFVRLLLGFLPLCLAISCLFWGIPQIDAYWRSDGEHLADAAEGTLAVISTPTFGPDHVFLSLWLQELTSTEGISEFDLRSIIAAAANETEADAYDKWLEETYEFAALLLGLSKVESNYCRNIGGGVAYEEVEKRLELAREEAPDEVPWWEANLAALETLASQLRVDVDSIPGSLGAGAVSCFQLMPVNWLRYGGGDYRRPFQAALNSARFLKAHGYPEDPEAAVLAYNFNAGQPYVEDVLAGRAIWEMPVTTAHVTEPTKVNVLTTIMIYTEFLAWYVGDYQLGSGIGPAGEFVHPYPGSSPTSYFWKQAVYAGDGTFLINHPGQDYGEISGGPIVAAHAGEVIFARYLCPNSQDPNCIESSDPSLAVKWWISGYTIVIRGRFDDGSPVCTGYGHGSPGSIRVGVGDVVTPGQHIMDAGTTGFSTGVHLHFSVSNCGTTFYDPNLYVE